MIANPWRDAGNRFRFASVCILTLGIAGWLLSFVPYDDLLDKSGTPLGGDFVMLYVAGQTMAEGQAATLYDDALNQSRSSAIFPTMDPTLSWPFRYPPTVATVMSPLSRLPFVVSFFCFFGIQVWLLTLSIYLLRGSCECLRDHSIWIWPMIGAPLVVETLVGGQSSMLGLVCVSAY
ncbi:MAG: glycosyltransferase family 87 protein, partial [Planctomycetota bacterium]